MVQDGEHDMETRARSRAAEGAPGFEARGANSHHDDFRCAMRSAFVQAASAARRGGPPLAPRLDSDFAAAQTRLLSLSARRVKQGPGAGRKGSVVIDIEPRELRASIAQWRD